MATPDGVEVVIATLEAIGSLINQLGHTALEKQVCPGRRFLGLLGFRSWGARHEVQLILMQSGSVFCRLGACEAVRGDVLFAAV